MKSKTAVCPYCGETIPKKAKSCPHCGSDEATGWSEGTYLDGIDLPDDQAYDEALAEEFGTGKARSGSKKWIVITALVVLAVFIAGALTAVAR